MTSSLIGALPRHLYVFVDTAFTGRTAADPARYQPAVWFGLVSTPGRMWGCTVLLENGAVYRNLPPHALAFSPVPYARWTAQDAQKWDCYGTDFSVVEYSYLAGLRCLVKTRATTDKGRYLFSVAPVGDGFSAQPEQAKEFHVIALDNGRLTIQPTDRVVYEEKSFTSGPLAFPHGLRAQTEVYRCE